MYGENEGRGSVAVFGECAPARSVRRGLQESDCMGVVTLLR